MLSRCLTSKNLHPFHFEVRVLYFTGFPRRPGSIGGQTGNPLSVNVPISTPRQPPAAVRVKPLELPRLLIRLPISEAGQVVSILWGLFFVPSTELFLSPFISFRIPSDCHLRAGKSNFLCNPLAPKLTVMGTGKVTRRRVKWLQGSRPMTSRRAGISRALVQGSANHCAALD